MSQGNFAPIKTYSHDTKLICSEQTGQINCAFRKRPSCNYGFHKYFRLNHPERRIGHAGECSAPGARFAQGPDHSISKTDSHRLRDSSNGIQARRAAVENPAPLEGARPQFISLAPASPLIGGPKRTAANSPRAESIPRTAWRRCWPDCKLRRDHFWWRRLLESMAIVAMNC